MVRGAEYDNGVPQSDNAFENGPNAAHGVPSKAGGVDEEVRFHPTVQSLGLCPNINRPT